MNIALIDAGPIIAYYNAGDDWHSVARRFFEEYKGILITTEAVCTEVMWIIDAPDVQGEFLHDVAREIYKLEPLNPSDFHKIADLNSKYHNAPGDFADLSLVAVADRLQIFDIVSLDRDFDIYRSYSHKKAFTQLFPKWKPTRQ